MKVNINTFGKFDLMAYNQLIHKPDKPRVSTLFGERSRPVPKPGKAKSKPKPVHLPDRPCEFCGKDPLTRGKSWQCDKWKEWCMTVWPKVTGRS